MDMHFVFASDDKITAKNVAEIVDGRKDGNIVKYEYDGDAIYTVIRDFSYRCDKAMRILKNSDAVNIRYTGAVVDNFGQLYKFNPKNGPGTRLQFNDEQYGDLPEIGSIYLAIKTVEVPA